jgi:hypothetical protein
MSLKNWHDNGWLLEHKTSLQEISNSTNSEKKEASAVMKLQVEFPSKKPIR